MVTTAFLDQARLHARSLGVAGLPLVVLPHPVGDLPPDDLRELARAAWPHIRTALTESLPEQPDFWVEQALPSMDGAGQEDCEVCRD